MTLDQLRSNFAGFCVFGTGTVALVCRDAFRITLFRTEAEAIAARICGLGCESRHKGYRLSEPKAPEPVHTVKTYYEGRNRE
jgi:hypothetical protein